MEFQVYKFDDAYNVVTDGGSDVWASVPIKNRSNSLFKDFHYSDAKAEAREAAELLKAFFEAKAAGKVARLMVEGFEKTCNDSCGCTDLRACYNYPHLQRPKNAVIDQMNAQQKRAAERAEFQQRLDENKANKKREAEALKIGELAAVIFAHNAHDFDERRAVQSAAKILQIANEAPCNE